MGYDTEGKIIYELTKINSNFKEYNNDGELIYEGDHLNGYRNGKGKEFYKGELTFVEEYLNEKKIEKENYLKIRN